MFEGLNSVGRKERGNEKNTSEKEEWGLLKSFIRAVSGVYNVMLAAASAAAAGQQTPEKFIALHTRFKSYTTTSIDWRDISFLTAAHVKDLPSAFIKVRFSTE